MKGGFVEINKPKQPVLALNEFMSGNRYDSDLLRK